MNYRLLGALSQVAAGNRGGRRASASLVIAEELSAARHREQLLATEV